jgi:hypothetical protein
VASRFEKLRAKDMGCCGASASAPCRESCGRFLKCRTLVRVLAPLEGAHGADHCSTVLRERAVGEDRLSQPTTLVPRSTSAWLHATPWRTSIWA